MRRYLTSLTVVTALLLAAAPAVGQGQESGGETEANEAEKAEEMESGEEEQAAKDEETADNEEAEQDDMMAEESSGMDEEMSVEETDTAEETDTGGHPSETNLFVVAPHVGVLVPQLFNDLGTWPIFSLEVGVMPPMEALGNPLEIAVLARYTQPGAAGDGSDGNLGETGGESYSWDLTQRTLTLDLVGIWRFRDLAAKLDPYGLIGPRVNFMETTMTAQGNGSQFGEVKETNVEFGLVLGGGVDYQLGPGTLFGELKFGWSNLDQTLTGNTNAGAFVLDVGYRFYPF